nr:zinc finger, CCHC-type [Tanacetum cinerariifolium]
MHFLLFSLSVVYVLTTPMLEDGGENPTVVQVRRRAEWDNDDYVCRGLILNGMPDFLFDVYQNVETSKELWDTLEAKYMGGDASSKKFLVSNFTNYKMTDSRPVLEQYNELFRILRSHLHIEESLRVQDSDKLKGNNVGGPSVVNIKCGKPGHLKWDCKGGNVGNKANGSCTNGSRDGSSNPLKGHVHFKRMQDMSKKGLILAFDMDTKKCKTCMLNKITKKPFQNVKRETKVLELIHSDLCDLHATPSLGNKKYFVTIIDDAFRAAVRLPDPKLKTLGERGIECIFIGYAEHSKAFRFYVIEPNDSVAINSIVESGDAIFDEHRFSSVPRSSQRSLKDGTEDFGGLVVFERVTEKVVQQPESELRKRKRHRTSKDFGPEFQLYLIEGTRDEIPNQHSYCFNVEDDPKTFDEAIKFWDVTFWKEAINDEMDSIMGNNTWMDVKIACLNEELEEEVYMNQLWASSCLAMKTSKIEGSGKGVIICLYVDDMLIFGTNQVQVDLTNGFLSSRFSMKDMGEADVILGIRIKHKSNGIAISQSLYIEKVLKKFNYSDCTPVSTPLDTCEKLMPNKGPAVSQLEHSRVIGCLMYAMTCIRSDIAFAMGKLSRYTSNPSTQHWQAIQMVLKYLKKTMDYRLVYSGYQLEGYTDARWISNTEDNSSTSGWVFLLGGEAEWLKNLILEIPLWVKPMASISIRCDSVATLAKAYSQMYNGKSRHLGFRHSMIRDLITNGVVSIEFVRSQQNLADHLTKGLARDYVTKSAEGMRLKSN